DQGMAGVDWIDRQECNRAVILPDERSRQLAGDDPAKDARHPQLPSTHDRSATIARDTRWLIRTIIQDLCATINDPTGTNAATSFASASTKRSTSCSASSRTRSREGRRRRLPPLRSLPGRASLNEHPCRTQ